MSINMWQELRSTLQRMSKEYYDDYKKYDNDNDEARSDICDDILMEMNKLESQARLNIQFNDQAEEFLRDINEFYQK